MIEKLLSTIINKIYLNDLELMYGKGSNVVFNSIKFCTTNKFFTIDCKLFMSETTLFEEVGVDGLKLLLEDSWVWTGFDEKRIAFVISCEII